MVLFAQHVLLGTFFRKRSGLRSTLAVLLLTAFCSALPAATLTWDIAPGTVGAGDSAISGGAGTWDTTNGNWTADGGATNVAWPGSGTDNDAVFEGAAGAVSIAGGVTANDITFNTTGYTIQNSMLTLNGATPTITTGVGVNASISSAIAGAAGLTKTGAGTLILSSASNSFSGGVALNQGTLQIGAATNLPSGNTVTLSGGGAFDMTGAMTLANSVSIAAGQAGTLRMIGATTGVLTGNYAGVAGTLTLDVSGGSGFSGLLMGSASGPALGSTVNIIGTSNANNVHVGFVNGAYESFFSNAKVVFSGTGNVYLAGGNGTASNVTFGALDGGVSSPNPGAYQGTLIGFDNTAGTVTIAGVADGNFSGTIFNGNGAPGAVSLVKNGGSTQTLSGTNTYTGSTTINGGILSIGSAANLPAGSAMTLSGGAALDMTGAMTLANSVSIAAGQAGTLRMVGAKTGVLTGNYAGVAGTLTLDVSGGSGFSGLLMGSASGPALGSTVNIIGTSNANNVQVGFVNSAYESFFSNAKVVFSGTGNMYLAAGNGTASNVTFGALDGGVSSPNPGAYQGTLIGFDNTAGTVTIAGVADGNFSGTIFNGNGAPGAVALVKNGGSTQTLSGTNTYTGSTTINGGTLRVDGTHTGTGQYTVNSGGTLGGTGSFNGGVLVNSGGTLSPGMSPGTLSGGSLAMQTGSNFVIEIDGLTAGDGFGYYDQYIANGAVDLASNGGIGATLQVSLTTPLSSAADGSEFIIIDQLAAGAVIGTFAYDGASLLEGDSFVVDTWNRFTISYAGGNGNDVVLTYSAVVPEPSTVVLLGLGIVSMTVLARRRRRRAG